MVGGHVWQGVCMAGAHVWQGGMCGKGACMVGAVCVAGGVCVARGVHGRGCMAGGMHATHAPQTLRDMVGQCAGGTHPTGMHSCIYEVHKIIKKISLENCDNCVLNRFGKLDLCKFLQIIGEKNPKKGNSAFFCRLTSFFFQN